MKWASQAEPAQRPTSQQLRRLFVNSAVPFVAFGFIDQTVLIRAGDTIDATLGVSLGLHTLAAAAVGQVASDTCGVVFGGTIEALALRLGLPLPGLTDGQLRLGLVKRVSTCGSALGVIIGCCLGMVNLLMVDLEATERAKKAEELRSITKLIMDDGRNILSCQRATLWIADNEAKELWTTFGHGLKDNLRIKNSPDSIAGWVAHNQKLLNIPDLKEDPRWSKRGDGSYVPSNMLCAPVVKGSETIAVIQLLDRTSQRGETIPFEEADERLLLMLATHVQIFMSPDEVSPAGKDDQGYIEWIKRMTAGHQQPGLI